jgi:hypothetical protein
MKMVETPFKPGERPRVKAPKRERKPKPSKNGEKYNDKKGKHFINSSNHEPPEMKAWNIVFFVLVALPISVL